MDAIGDLNRFIDENGMFDSLLDTPPMSEEVWLPQSRMSENYQETQLTTLQTPPILLEAQATLREAPQMLHEAKQMLLEATKPLQEAPQMLQEAQKPAREMQGTLQGTSSMHQEAEWTPVSKCCASSKEPLNDVPFKASFVFPEDKSCVYSKKFNMLLVKWQSSFTMAFDCEPTNEQMFVRATIEYNNQIEALKRVETCEQHNKDPDEVMAMSVLRSCDPGEDLVYHCGDPRNPESRFSVVMGVKNTNGLQPHHSYYMVCKNSCCTGIKRRKTDLIFTYEDKRGKVYARQVMSLKTCASPYRDLKLMMEKVKETSKGAKPPCTVAKRPRFKSVESEPGGTEPTESHSIEQQLSGQQSMVMAPQPAVHQLAVIPPTVQKNVELPSMEPQPTEFPSAKPQSIIMPPLPITNRRIMDAGLRVMLYLTEMEMYSHNGNPEALKNCNASIESMNKVLTDLANLPR